MIGNLSPSLTSPVPAAAAQIAANAAIQDAADRSALAGLWDFLGNEVAGLGREAIEYGRDQLRADLFGSNTNSAPGNVRPEGEQVVNEGPNVRGAVLPQITGQQALIGAGVLASVVGLVLLVK